ncbi:lysozyme [Paraburkholderia pallida]|uniref:Lysozyme n=1 Tax=Paraburkholderia pallida TaxID=2547399 RepID=A0A4P7CYW0_9BURK|nr:lysozyme [Paraburkholderia pallida]QBQ99263.1 peptidase [Paraburkholderia pallida]
MLSDLFAAILALFRRAPAPAPVIRDNKIIGPVSGGIQFGKSPTLPGSTPVVAPLVPVPVTAPAPGAKPEVAAPHGPTWIDLCRPMTEHFERCVLIAYPDPASELGVAIQARGQWEHVLNGMAIPQDLLHLDGAPWTCGYGCTGADIVYGTVWTPAHADSQLTIRLNQAADAVDRRVKVEITPAQKGALADFVFNEGEENFATSMLLRLLNASDFVGAAAQFARWDLAKGKVMPGLVTRRAANKQLFTTGAWQP